MLFSTSVLMTSAISNLKKSTGKSTQMSQLLYSHRRRCKVGNITSYDEDGAKTRLRLCQPIMYKTRVHRACLSPGWSHGLKPMSMSQYLHISMPSAGGTTTKASVTFVKDVEGWESQRWGAAFKDLKLLTQRK